MSILDYRDFLADTPRVAAFQRAIEATVSPGQVVLDLGTGIGTYAMFAARAGGRVLAVEADPVIDIARGLAADNGLADRIEFLHGRIEALEPPGRVDVLIFEDFSPYLYHTETVEVLDDVRRRWLEASAVSIPKSIRVHLAPVDCPETYAGLMPGGRDAAYGLAVRRLTDHVLNRLHRACWPARVLLAEPVEVARLSPVSLDDFTLQAEARWLADRDGTLHGLGLWIDFELAAGVEYSNQPSGRSSGWDQQFLPLGEPLRVAAGDEIEARVTTLGPSPRQPEWWSWRVRSGGEWQEMNTFRGVPLSLSRLQRASLESRPCLTPEGRVRRAVLELIDGERTLGEIAHELMERFPRYVRSEREAYRAVSRELEMESEGPAGPYGGRLVEARAER